MIHGLSKHTKNAGPAVAYFLDDKYFKLLDHSEVDLDNYDPKKRGDWLPREPKPVVLEGDPAQLTALCDSLSFKNRYTSGVLSFSPAETAKIAATPGMKEQLIEELRAYAYAGVKNDDSKPLLVVQHEHTGRLELHYLIPRVSLESGKYFNPFPPNYDGRRGKGANNEFIEQDKTFVDYVCHKYGLQNPRDPEVSREIKFDKFDSNKDLKAAINERISKLVNVGDIKSRDDVIRALERNGGTITRKGADYISVKFDNDKKAVRLRGAYYSEQSFEESRQVLGREGERISRTTEDIESAYAKTLLTRSNEVEKIHSLKGLAAERAEDFDRKSALELSEYADELKALKDNLPSAAEFSRGVSDSLVASPELATGSFDGIETGVASGTSDADPILTGDPGSDQLIRAFHSMQKKLAAEELQRTKAKWQVDPNHEKMIREMSDLMSRLFGGLATGKNFVSGRPGAMTADDIAEARLALTERHRELQRELKAVVQIARQKERTEPLRAILDEPREPVFEAKPTDTDGTTGTEGSGGLQTSTEGIGELLGIGPDGKKLKPKPAGDGTSGTTLG